MDPLAPQNGRGIEMANAGFGAGFPGPLPPLEPPPLQLLGNGNPPNMIPVVNTQNGQVFPLTLNGINLANFNLGGLNNQNALNGNLLTGIPFAYQQFQQFNQPKEGDPLHALFENVHNNNQANMLQPFHGQPAINNQLGNIPAAQLPQLNILQPNMIFGNIMAIPNAYMANQQQPQNNILPPNNFPPPPPRLIQPPPNAGNAIPLNLIDLHPDPPLQFQDEQEMDEIDAYTPGISSPDITDDESHWTAFDRAIKTRKLMKKALVLLHKADLIDKDKEILHICDLVELKMKKIYDKLDEMDAE